MKGREEGKGFERVELENYAARICEAKSDCVNLIESRVLVWNEFGFLIMMTLTFTDKRRNRKDCINFSA